jgi:hypothetical protein
LSRGISNPARLGKEADQSVIRFLSYALMLAQLDLLERRDHHSTVDISFVPIAPGEPKTLYKRFRIAPSPPGGTSRSAPPWTAQGILLNPDFKPSIFTHTDYLRGKHVFEEEFSFQVNGCTIRADIFNKIMP